MKKEKRFFLSALTLIYLSFTFRSYSEFCNTCNTPTYKARNFEKSLERPNLEKVRS